MWAHFDATVDSFEAFVTYAAKNLVIVPGVRISGSITVGKVLWYTVYFLHFCQSAHAVAHAMTATGFGGTRCRRTLQDIARSTGKTLLARTGP